MPFPKDPVKAAATRKKMSKAKKGKYFGENNPNFGKHHTDESRRKISEAAKKRKRSPHSEETRKKISEAQKGKTQPPHTEEQRKKIGEASKRNWADPEFRKRVIDARISGGKMGHPISEATRNKLREINTGKKPLEATRKKMAESHKGKKLPPRSEQWRNSLSEVKRGKNTGEKNPFFGRHHSEESKKRISAAKQGKSLSEEHKQKLRGRLSSNLGKTASIETRKKISEAAKGRKISEETRRKMREIRQKPDMREKTRLATIKYNVDHSWYGDVKYYDGPQYCDKWTKELRERVRSWFGYRCVECGTPQNKRKLAIHHVHYNKRLCCDDTPRTLVALCSSCHALTSKGDREYWSNHFQEIIDSYYGGRCWFTRDEMKKFNSSGPD